jgi:probable HAF family extracellular repeat protein
MHVWGKLMSDWKSFGLALFAAVGLLDETNGSAHAQCASFPGTITTCATEWSNGSVINLGGLPVSTNSQAFGINDVGQVVGRSDSSATEWSGGSTINLGPGVAEGINNAGQAVGFSAIGFGSATEWSNGSVINLGGLPSVIDA